MVQRPVSLGACQPERLTAGWNASSGGVPSACTSRHRRKHAAWAGALLLQLISSMTSLAGVGWTVYTCLQVRCLPDNGPCNPFKNLAE